MSRRPLALALCSAFIASHAFAAEPAAGNIKWSAPWKAGMTLEYATSSLTEETQGGTTTRELETDIEIVAITEATDKGFLQTWKSKPGAYRVVEMAPAQKAMVEALAAGMAGEAVEIELAKDGTVERARNAAALVGKMKALTRPLFEKEIEAQVATLPPDQQAARRAAARENTTRALDTMFSPDMAEALLLRKPTAFNGFFGIDVEPETTYEASFEAPMPLGGPSLPMKTTFVVSVSEDDPDDLFIDFETQADQDKFAELVKHMGSKLSGGHVWTEAELKQIAGVSMRDKGLFVVHRPTGVIEMFETTRTTTSEGKVKVERERMRQLGGAHDHVWTDEAE